MLTRTVADLEELAIRRDRGYLVRLLLFLGVGVFVSVLIWKGLTGGQTTNCIASAFLGQDSGAGQPTPH